MQTKNKIVFIALEHRNIETELDMIIEYKEKKDWQTLVITTDYKSQLLCKKNNINFKTPLKYLTPDRHKKVAIESIKLTKEWCKKDDIEHVLNYRNVSICEILEYDFYMIFAGILIDIELYKSIIEIEKPDKIVTVKKKNFEKDIKNLTNMKGHDNFILLSLTNKSKISVEIIDQPTNIIRDIVNEKKSKFEKIYGYMEAAKRQHKLTKFMNWRKEIRYKVKIIWNYFIYRWFADYIIKTFSKKKNKIAFAGTVRAANNSADLLKKNRLNGVICLKLPGSNKIPLEIVPVIDLNFFKTTEIETIVSRKRKEFLDLLKNDNLVKYFEKEFVYSGIFFWQPMKQKLEYIFGEYIPLIIYGMELTKEMTDRIGIDILLSTSDRNPVICGIMKTLQSKHKKSFVYLHGIDYFNVETSKIYGR